jgi:hypothetical protein
VANDSASQQALSEDVTFRRRVKDALSIVAWEVVEEDPATPDHKKRVDYARHSVIPSLDAVASTTASWLVNRVNIFSFETSYNFAARAVVTASGDPDIQAQIRADWNTMAGVGDVPETR